MGTDSSYQSSRIAHSQNWKESKEYCEGTWSLQTWLWTKLLVRRLFVVRNSKPIFKLTFLQKTHLMKKICQIKRAIRKQGNERKRENRRKRKPDREKTPKCVVHNTKNTFSSKVSNETIKMDAKVAHDSTECDQLWPPTLGRLSWSFRLTKRFGH